MTNTNTPEWNAYRTRCTQILAVGTKVRVLPSFSRHPSDEEFTGREMYVVKVIGNGVIKDYKLASDPRDTAADWEVIIHAGRLEPIC
jgi:hypothetical protein